MKKAAEQTLATDNKEWQKIIEQFPEANFPQSPEYAKMNELLGNKVIIERFNNKGYAAMFVKNAKRGRYLEIPCGPLIDWNNVELAESTIEQIKQIASTERCVFVRVRPQINNTPDNLAKMSALGLKKSPMHLAAEHTVVINLLLSEDDLLKNMRRQTRYEVRRAEKLGIKVSSSNSDEIFKEFHRVQAETAKRQGFIPPSLKVLMAEKEAFGKNIRIYFAETDTGERIAYGLIIKNGYEGDYFEAASTPLNRKLPGAYALLWQVTKDLKKEGYQRFNLWGIAPAGQPNHRYAGVTTFKTGFGGEVVEFIPAHDIVISKIGYLKDLVIEKARKKRRHL